MLNFVQKILYHLITYILFFSLYFILLINNININLVDVYSRVLPSESILTILYFLWTNFFYLYFIVIFSILILLILYLNILNNKCITFIFILNIFIISFFLFINLLVLNIIDKSLLNTPYLFNTLLLNNINKYHPLLFYCTFLGVILIYLFKYYFKRYSSFTRLTYSLLLSLYITTFLGSWWAYQEGSWGGWWEWDASEMYILILGFTLWSFYHNKIIIYKSKVYYLFFIIKYTFIFILYILLQISLSVVSHNFGIINQGSFVYINYLLLLGLFLFIMNNIILYNQLVNFYPFWILLEFTHSSIHFNKYIIKKYIVSIILIFICILSFSITFSSILQSFISLFIQLIPSNTFNYLSLVVVILWISLIPNKFCIPIIYYSVLGIFLLNYIPSISILHIFIIITLVTLLIKIPHKNIILNLFHIVLLLLIWSTFYNYIFTLPTKGVLVNNFTLSWNLTNFKSSTSMLLDNIYITSSLNLYYNYTNSFTNELILNKKNSLSLFGNLLNIGSVDNWIQFRISNLNINLLAVYSMRNEFFFTKLICLYIITVLLLHIWKTNISFNYLRIKY